MLKNYLVIALRTLRRRPGTTALHVGGLAVGITCCFLALLYVQDELAYDRFHEHTDRIFQLSKTHRFGDHRVDVLSTSADGIEALRTGVPGVEAVAVTAGETGIVRRPGGEGFETEDVLFADSSFFEVFTFPLLRGDAETALGAPGQAVLSVSFAERLFGDRDPLGQPVELEQTGFGARDAEPLALTVAGVAADPPATSTIQFELLVSGTTPVADWHGEPKPRLANGGASYVLLRAAADTAAARSTLDQIARADEAHTFGEFVGINVLPLTGLHFARHGDGLTGKPLYLVLFSAIAGLVLLLACINYANLATALALGRATEVGVRKAVGAQQSQLRGQFIAEALLLALAAGAVAVALTALALPSLNAFLGKSITLGAAGALAPLAVAGIVGLTGLLAGAYPAFVLARFRPAAILKGERVHGRGGTRVRQGLIVFQFAVTAVLLAGAVLVSEQLRYAQRTDLGFRGDQVVTLPLKTAALAGQRDALQYEMGALSGVRHTSIASAVPGEMKMVLSLSPVGTESDPTDDVNTWFVHADAEYAETLGLELAAGRWFREGEDQNVAVLTTTAARSLGLMTTDPATALGQTLGGREAQEVVGVVEDFHHADLRSEIRPVAFFPLHDKANQYLLALQLDRSDLPGALAAVRATWEREVPTYPFEPTFVDEHFAELLREDRQLGQLFGAFAGVTVLLALFGLFGLAAYAAERRRKEVGVRKVLGASVAGLVALLARDFVRLVVLALLVAVPVTFWLAQHWLEDFAYPAPFRLGPFLAIALGMLALALAAVSYHALRTATADPVKSLRYE